MGLHAYILLPESDDTIVSISENKEEFNLFLNSVRRVLIHLKRQQDATIYYDKDNINTFFEKCSFVVDDVYLAQPETVFRLTFGKSAREIKDNASRQKDCLYLLWQIDTVYVEHASPIISELAERIYQYPVETYVLIRFATIQSTKRAFLTVFKDASHIDGLPEKFVHIPLVGDLDELELWLATHHRLDFSLLNKHRFERINRVSQGKPIFKEIDTGYFWYLDNLHKNEYEVFDARGRHIGVANLQGEIDFSKKVPGRMIE